MPSSRRSSWPRDRTQVSCGSCIAGGFFTTSATWEAPTYESLINLPAKITTKGKQKVSPPEQQVFTTDHTGHLHLLCPPLKPRKGSLYCWEGTSYFSHLTELSPYLSLNSYLGDNGKGIEYFSQCQNVQVTKQTFTTEWLVTYRWFFISFLTLLMSSLLWPTVKDVSLYFSVTLVGREVQESDSHAKLFQIQPSGHESCLSFVSVFWSVKWDNNRVPALHHSCEC